MFENYEPPSLTAEDVVACARGWLGTPYHHQANLKLVGCDCLGLVRGVWQELYGFEVEKAPAYSRDWAEAGRRETMLQAAGRHLKVVDRCAASAGDVVVFRLRDGFVAKHADILTGPETMVHAMEGCNVSEVSLGPWWQRRVAGVFRFPGVQI